MLLLGTKPRGTQNCSLHPLPLHNPCIFHSHSHPFDWLLLTSWLNCLIVRTANVNTLPSLVQHAPLIRLRRRALYKFVLIDWLIDTCPYHFHLFWCTNTKLHVTNKWKKIKEIYSKNASESTDLTKGCSCHSDPHMFHWGAENTFPIHHSESNASRVKIG